MPQKICLKKFFFYLLLGLEHSLHTGSVKHLDEDPDPVLRKNDKKKDRLIADRSSAHNDDDTLRIIDNELAKASKSTND